MPTFEPSGPRNRLFFDPTSFRAGVVTCGGLCPGINDVIRALVMVLHHRYGVAHLEGYRYGYEGLNPACGHPVLTLDPQRVERIHETGGTILGSSRGPQDVATMVDYLQSRRINALFVIGGDGTLRGGHEIALEAIRRDANISVIGIPKTIDNDIMFIDQSFGFQTAFTKAVDAIAAAHIEAKGAPNGVGLVKLMGRHSGFIAAHAGLANNDPNYVLIPEVNFPLDGDGGLLEHLRRRLAARGHAVIVAAEGAGQCYCQAEGADRSGNRALGDIGLFLRERINEHMCSHNVPVNIKYIDPSYMIRGVPATPHDSVYCFQLAADAAHAAMAGRTDMVIGKHHGRFVHIPIATCVRQRQQLDPEGDLWQSVLEATGQPHWPAAGE